MGDTLPDTQERVLEHADPEITRRLHREMEARIYYYADEPSGIDKRLQELENEWDMERVLETNAAGISLFGVLMSTRDRKWLVLPFAVSGFLMQHALQGWCPPVGLFRRIGIRTMKEINMEYYALKVLRGDFDDIAISSEGSPSIKAEKALKAVEAELSGSESQVSNYHRE